MSALEAVFVRPVEALLGFLFVRLVALTASPGLSLVLLSLAVTLITTPLYALAEKWKKQEQAMQRRMARDLASIRKHYSGQKRFYLVRNVYRLHGYRSIYGLRTSLGLLIQIPFFFGAYGYLSRYQGYAGTGFLFVRDLGLPDGLLWGANLLPFVMTAVNIASSLAYTRSRSAKENLQLFAMALLFLVVLYDRPAGLLVYWTMNNLFSLLRNLLPRKAEERPAAGEQEDGQAAEPTIGDLVRGAIEGGALGRENLAEWVFVPVLALLGAQSFWLLRFDRSFKLCIAATALAGTLLTLAVLVQRLRTRRAPAPAPLPVTLAPLWVLSGVSAWLLLFERRQSAYLSNPNVKMLSVLIQDLIICVAARALVSPGGSRPVTRPIEHRGRIFAVAAAFLFSYLLVFSPMLIYFSSPEDVGMRLGGLLARNAPWALLLSAASAALFRLLDRQRQHRVLEILLAVLLLVAAYNYVVPGRYGILDELALEKAHLLDATPWSAFALDILLAALAWAAARTVLRRWPLAVIPGIVAVALAFAAQLAVGAAGMERSGPDGAAAARDSGLPAGARQAHAFSREGRNVVVLVADMFNGNYMGRLLEEQPEYARRLEGFAWYPNTLSISSHTATSFPALLAGWEFSPDRMNSRPGTGLAKYEAAMRTLLDELRSRRQEITVVNPMYVDLAAINRQSYGGALRIERSDAYIGYWKGSHGRSPEGDPAARKNRLLVMVTLFQSAPFMLKPRIYDSGSWLIFRKSYQLAYIARKTVENYAYLDLLPDISTAGTGGSGGTFKLIHTQFTHEPFGVTRDGGIIEDDFPDPRTRSFVDGTSAYYTARRMIDFLLAWARWMKDQGVYDNTAIIVVSDHGNNAMDTGLELPPGLDSLLRRTETSRARPLLMVKGFGSSGPLKIDERFMSNADTHAMALAAVDGEADLARAVPGRPRELRFYELRGNWRGFTEGERTAYNVYVVKDDIRLPGNWSRE